MAARVQAHDSASPLTRVALALCAWVLLLAPIPVHACLAADADACTCCCTHEADAAATCCADAAAPLTADPSCCFILDLSDEPLVPQARDAAPAAPVLAIASPFSTVVFPPAVSATHTAAGPPAAPTPRRLSVLCSFLN